MTDPKEVLKRLKKHYADKPFLKARTPFQNLVAVVLSAQCTDARVNMVTKDLFKKYHSVEDYASIPISELERDIRSTGFYKSKAKAIQESAKKVIADYKGKVPKTMEEITKLRGVARKTGNIVLWQSYGITEGIAVDTHVKRVSYRLGLTNHKDPVKIEKDLMELYPKSEWSTISYRIISHGRALCKAPTPVCSQCFMSDICPKKGVTKSK